MCLGLKSRGFVLKNSQLEHADADRLELLSLVMSLPLYRCVGVGRSDILNHLTLLEKAQTQFDPNHWISENSSAIEVPGTNGAAPPDEALQNGIPLPIFYEVARN